eukprot:TRINITY_DN24882_c0_g1_i1.p1 TRINITY_DN24882_c0_g1~~TRINITY_DN24882_c0_g1_i1.p1  ORF type:complete len:260 (-),score=16.80 TRINITY_DN24882_c0_g1_i1:176-955(-)
MKMIVFFFQAEDGIRDLVRSRGLGDVYKRQLEEREHFEGSIFEAGFAVHERMNTLLTRDLRMYMEATYGTQSIESGLVAKALLDYSGPCTIRSWQHALELLGMVSGQLPAFSGQMSAARRGVRSYLVWAATAHPAHLARRLHRKAISGGSSNHSVEVVLSWSSALCILEDTPLLQQPIIAGDPFVGVTRASILAAAGTVHTEAIMQLLTSVPSTYHYTYHEKRALGTVLATAVHATRNEEGWSAFEGRKHKLRYYTLGE